MIKKTTFFKSICAATALMISLSTAAQTSLYLNFEVGSNAADWQLEVGVATASIVDFASARSGSKSMKIDGFEANTGYHFKNEAAGNIVAKPGEWVHTIIHAISTLEGGMAAPSFSSTWAKITPGFQNLSTTDFTRFAFKRQYPSTAEVDMEIYPRLRVKPGDILTNEIHFDDLVLYSHSSDETDLVAPEAATNFAYGTRTATSNQFSWKEGVDILTGVQLTYILRTTNTSAEAPELKPQVGYSVAGGAAGLNTIGDWTVIATVNAGTITYTDVSVVEGKTYRYAIVHKDLAYNNSVALLSNVGTTSAKSLTANEITLYPVPVSHTLYISGIDVATAKVYSISGKLLMEFSEINNGLLVPSLPNGLYIVKLTDKNGNVSTASFVKK